MSQVALRDQNERTSIQAVAFGRDAGGGNLAPQNLGDIVRFAEVMARADIAIPKHLRDNPGACLAVCMQAFKWEMDPFSVAQKSYKVGDQMAYEAQLIAAVINTRAGLKRRPAIQYDGAGADRRCIVTFEAADGSVHVYESPRFAAITTKNSPLWKSDPDQQLGYYSIRAGARRHFPEVILGVYDRDELDGARDVTPQDRQSGFAARMSNRPRPTETTAREGFDSDFIDGQLGLPKAAAQEPASEREDAPPVSDAGEDDRAPQGSGEAEMQPEKVQAGGEIDNATRNLLAEAASKFLTLVSDESMPKDQRQDALAQSVAAWKQEIDAKHHDRLKRVVDRANAVILGKLGVPAAVKLLAAEIGVKETDVEPAGGR